VCPRAPVQVVGTDDQEDVVDDAHLRVDVNGCAIGVFEVVQGDAVASRSAQDVGGVLPSDPARRIRRASAAIGVSRHDGNHVELAVTPKRGRERVGGVGRPEILVFDIHESPGAPKCLEVGARDAAFAVGRERIRRALRGIRAEYLDGVRSVWRRVLECGSQRFGMARLAGEVPDCDTPRVPMIERGRVLPALTKGVLEIADGRTAYAELDVVPRRIGAVALVELDCLAIAGVA